MTVQRNHLRILFNVASDSVSLRLVLGFCILNWLLRDAAASMRARPSVGSKVLEGQSTKKKGKCRPNLHKTYLCQGLPPLRTLPIVGSMESVQRTG